MNATPSHLLRNAQALELAGRVEEAAIAYRIFLDLQPNRPDIWSDYAGQLIRLDRLEEADEACSAALQINPRHAAARINQGVILMRRDRLAAATSLLRVVLQMFPDRVDAKLFLAECLLKQKHLDLAQKALEELSNPGVMVRFQAGMNSQLAELWAICGLALLEVQRFAASEAACRSALQVDPGNLRAKANLGSIQMAQGYFEQAEVALRQLLADHPGDQNARLLLITCLARQGNLPLLRAEIDQVLTQAPGDIIVHKSLVGTYYTLGFWEDYREEIERFRKFEHDAAFLDFERSLVDLLFGDFPNGWRRYEARLLVPKKLRLNQRNFPQPRWSGEPFAGQTLLIWCEQGFGDSLMFIRYLRMVKALGGKVYLEVQPELVDVAATCPGVDLVIPKGSPFPPFDLQASVMSLPWIFKTGLESIPGEVPYVDVPTAVPNRQALMDCLAPFQDHTRIGLVWAGSPGHGRDFERSLPVALLSEFAALPDVAWFSFQLGRQDSPALPNLTSLAPHLSSFSDTAYALSGMDLLITVDTSIAHLAGALGVPALVLLSYQPDFRWLLGREDTPWYPTLRLYRQPRYGDWESVIQSVVSDLTLDA